METNKRIFEVTLEQAKEWYNSNNITLRAIALNVFSEEELTLNIQFIRNKMNAVASTRPVFIYTDNVKKLETLMDLELIAKYFNGNWKKTTDEIGYYICKTRPLNKDIIEILSYDSFATCSGTVYFKEYEYAEKALKILGDRIKYLFD